MTEGFHVAIRVGLRQSKDKLPGLEKRREGGRKVPYPPGCNVTPIRPRDVEGDRKE